MTKKDIKKIEDALVFFGIDSITEIGDCYTRSDAETIAEHTGLDFVDVMIYLNDRDRDILNYYKVEKFEAKIDRWLDYGPLPEDDVKAIIKGYKRNRDLTYCYIGDCDSIDDMSGVYTRKGTGNMYTVVYEYGIER